MTRPEAIARALADELPPAALEPRGGATPFADRPWAAPETDAEWSTIVKRCARERWTVLPVGGGTHLVGEPSPGPFDLVLSTARTTGVTAFAPRDGTITARTGTTLAELERSVQATHHLSPEVAAPERATLGGVLASGVSGFDRLRHGPARHQVLGLTTLHGDGTRVRSGGRVVKNVTGYDLHRLWCGSRGTLGVLLEATLRLYPRPRNQIVLRRTFDSRQAALEACAALGSSALQPLALLLSGPLGGPWTLDLVLAGRDEVLRHECDLAASVLGEHERRADGEAEEARAALRAEEERAHLVLATRPSRLPALLERIERSAEAHALGLHLRIHPALATVALRCAAPVPAERLSALAPDLGEFEARPRHPALFGAFPARIAPVARALMQRQRQTLDPFGVFAVRRFDDVL